MDKKFIDANELNDKLDSMKSPNSEYATDDYIDGFVDGISAAMSEILKSPATDIQPVKYGKWIRTDTPMFGNPYGSYQCSLCDAKIDYKTDYCSNCGASMDRE